MVGLSKDVDPPPHQTTNTNSDGWIPTTTTIATSDSTHQLAKQVMKVELQQQIAMLKDQLQEVTLKLQQLEGHNNSSDDDHNNDWDQQQKQLQIHKIPPLVSKRGYLFKWLDRTIGWSGTKWGLRFVVLNATQGQLSYYSTHQIDTQQIQQQPRYVLCLRGCAVRDDGWKRNPRYKVKRSTAVTASKNDSEQSTTLNPPLDEPGAYFFLFSIYQLPIDSNSSIISNPKSISKVTTKSNTDFDENMIVPLLRFSTPSLAEKMMWIQLISESCAYCETEQWLQEETERLAENEKQQRQQSIMTSAMPESKEGTLPPLYFAPTLPSSSSKSKLAKKGKQHERRPSFVKTPSAANFRSTTQNQDMDQIEKKTRGGYPPSKPMHRYSAPSYLSVEAPIQNYRGFFNLGVLILIGTYRNVVSTCILEYFFVLTIYRPSFFTVSAKVSNVRLLMSSVDSHGFVLTAFVDHLKELRHIQNDPWEQFPFVSGFILQVAFVLITFGIEYILSRQSKNKTNGRKNSKMLCRIGMTLHHTNAHLSLLVPLWIVWNFIDKPAIGGVLLFHATITWMKLLSYILANEDYRILHENTKNSSENSMLTLIEDLDPNDVDIRYPENITIRNMLYFWFCPSLTYQIAYPKTPRVRWWKISGILMRLVICVSVFTFVAAQAVTPVLSGLVHDLEVSGGSYTASMIFAYWLKLAIANTYLWLLLFYGYFHLYLNLFGELLRFGDRVFYRDWWNVLDVGAYWRLWNLPVHFWLVRHLYFPCLRHMNKTAANFVVFLLSAIMHEVLVSVPFHMIRPWSFIGMMMQIPLVAMTKIASKKSPTLGNMLFWVSFCLVGQPMAALLYTVDYQYAQKQEQLLATQCAASGTGGSCVK